MTFTLPHLITLTFCHTDFNLDWGMTWLWLTYTYDCHNVYTLNELMTWQHVLICTNHWLNSSKLLSFARWTHRWEVINTSIADYICHPRKQHSTTSSSINHLIAWVHCRRIHHCFLSTLNVQLQQIYIVNQDFQYITTKWQPAWIAQDMNDTIMLT